MLLGHEQQMPSGPGHPANQHSPLSRVHFLPAPALCRREAANTKIAEELKQQMVAAGFDEVRVRCRH
jgi:hypothetical protein